MHNESSSKEGVKVTADDTAKVVASEKTDELAEAAETGPSATDATSDAVDRIDLVQVT
ncbi:MAG TPA: hypothetical protein VGQ03_10180 [Nitrososphaera sp.]|jgi:hypothetical protein|nr:hypothetical protein [Nitrososphaera sp.]